MANNLWSALDAWQVSQIEAALGPAGSYADLQVATVTTAIVNDVDQWAGWSMPAVIVQGNRKQRRLGPHGDGSPHFEIVYPYTYVVITTGEREQSLADAKEIEKRLETAAASMINTAQQIGPIAGERVQRMRIGDADILAFPQESAGDLWYSVAFVQIDFNALA